jgi:glyoxylase-like metal-dependent hydrolase (beta-lactamase superfamily II)
MGVTVELLQVGSARHRGDMVGLPTREHVDFPVNVALIRHPNRGAILFDTGYGSSILQAPGLGFAVYRRVFTVALPEHQRIDVQLRKRGIEPDQIDRIILSHGHADHIGGLADLPSLPVTWSRATRDDFSTGTALSRALRGMFPALLPPHLAATAALLDDCPTVDVSALLPGFDRGFDMLGDGALIGVPLPGHARGQFGVLCRTKDKPPIFLIADAAWVIENVTGTAQPRRILDLIVDDADAYHRTLALLRRLHVLRPDMIIVPSHCPYSLRMWSHG